MSKNRKKPSQISSLLGPGCKEVPLLIDLDSSSKVKKSVKDGSRGVNKYEKRFEDIRKLNITDEVRKRRTVDDEDP